MSLFCITVGTQGSVVILSAHVCVCNVCIGLGVEISLGLLHVIVCVCEECRAIGSVCV